MRRHAHAHVPIAAALLLGLLTAVHARARALRPIGSSIGGGDDVVVTQIQAFRFPGGQITSSIEISSNGTVYPASFGTSNPTESVSQLSSRPAIYAYWDDLRDGSGADTGRILARLGLGWTSTLWRSVRSSQGDLTVEMAVDHSKGHHHQG